MNYFFRLTIVVGLCLTGTSARTLGSIYTVLAPIDPPAGFIEPILIGTIPAAPAMRIHIVELGVAGDADAGSGPVLFSALGAGVDFSWSAGQEAAGATYTLGPTPYIAATGPERGFVYATVSEWADGDSPIAIFWHGNLEPDGSHTSAFDSQGTYFNDPPGSTRAWLRYELVPVPEPSTLALAALGALGLLIARRRRRPCRVENIRRD